MKQRTNKLLSLVLTLALVAGMTPMLTQPAQASDTWTVIDKSTVKASEIPAGAMIALEKNTVLILDKDLSIECIDAWDYEANKCYELTVRDSGGHKLIVNAPESDYGINVHSFTQESGTVEIKTGWEDSGGLFAEQGDIIIQGGTLKVDSKNNGIYAKNGNIQISDATVDITTEESSAGGMTTQSTGNISITDSKVNIVSGTVGINCRSNGSITITNSDLHVKTNNNGIGSSRSVRIKDSTVYIEAKVYSIVSDGAVSYIDNSAVKATARLEEEMDFIGYSPEPEILWSKNRDGSGAVKWTGTPPLTSGQVQYFEVNRPGESTLPPDDPEEKAYYVFVGGGTANKATAKAGESVSITGMWGQSEFTFEGWEVISGNAVLKDPTQEVTSFTMPAEDVTIGGKYKHFAIDPSGNTSEKPNPFVDVASGNYFYEPVLWAYYRNPQVTNGIDASHFGPEQTVTRGQCVTFLWRAMGCPKASSTNNPFVDVKSGEYWYEPILWAVEKGITVGTDANHFSPTQTLSTAHIATFLYRCLGIGKDGWYEEAGNWALKEGLLSETGLTVSDKVGCPRGAVVTFLYRELAKPADNGAVNELDKNEFLLYVEDVLKVTGRGTIVSGRVVNGSVRVGDKVVLNSYEDKYKSPTKEPFTVLGIEMFRKQLDEAQKGDNVGILISNDTSLKVQYGAALLKDKSTMKNTPGFYVGTVKLNNTRKNALQKGDTFQLKWPGSDVSAMLMDLNGTDLKPNSTRTGVSVVLTHPVVWYVGQTLEIRSGGKVWGTFTITEIK